MEILNLDLNNYSINDLEFIFSLKDKNYDKQEVQSRHTALKTGLLNDHDLEINARSNILQFLEKAADILSAHVEPINSYRVQPSTTLKPHPANNVSHDENGHILLEPHKTRKEEEEKGLNPRIQGAPAGVINPLKYRTIKRALNIDSRFRTNYAATKSSDLSISLPVRFEKIINMRLSSIEIPHNSIYAVSDAYANNVIKVSWKTSGPAYDASAVVVLPDGNYTNAELVAAFNGALFINDLSGVLHLKCGINAQTGRFYFYNTALAYKVEFNYLKTGQIAESLSPQMTLGWMMGFRKSAYEGVAGQVITSEGLCMVSGPRYIFVSIDDYNNNTNNYFISAFPNSINAPNIIARITTAPTSATAASTTTVLPEDGNYTQLNRSREYFGPVDIQKLRITLYDEYGRIVNMNNMDWSLALAFEAIY